VEGGHTTFYAGQQYNGELVFRAPFYYPPDTVVVFTVEGVGYTTTNAVADLTQVLLHWEGAVLAPVSTNDYNCSYLISLTGGQEYTLEEASFTWPGQTNSYGTAPVYSFQTYHTLSFTGFHNATAMFPHDELRPGLGATRVATCTATVTGNVSFRCRTTAGGSGAASVTVGATGEKGKVKLIIQGAVKSNPENDVVLEAMDENGVVLASKPVTVAIPCTVKEKKAAGPTFGTRLYPIGDGMCERQVKWSYVVTITIFDQFGKPLGPAYKGAPVVENVSTGSGAGGVAEFGHLDENGEVDDLIGPGYVVGENVACVSPAASGWLSTTVTAPTGGSVTCAFWQQALDQLQQVKIDNGDWFTPPWRRKATVITCNPFAGSNLAVKPVGVSVPCIP